jgi:hypothetical protein
MPGPTLKSPIVFQCQNKYTLNAIESRITMFLFWPLCVGSIADG